MSEYKLTYFDFRIYGELPRWVLSAAGQPFTDVRLGYKEDQKEKWITLKPETPFGKLPILEVDGQMLCQSWSIARFLAKRFGLSGSNDIEDARIDMTVDCIRDMMDPIDAYIWHSKTPEEMEEKGKLWHQVKDEYFTKFEQMLTSNKGGDGYFVGDKITWADMAVVVMFAYAEGFDPERYPKLAAHRVRVEVHPGIAAWIKKRPVDDYEKQLHV